MTGCTVRRYEQLETSPETIEQELRPAVCEHRQTDRQTNRLKENYSIDSCVHIYERVSGLCTNICTYVHTYICMYVCMYVCVYVDV